MNFQPVINNLEQDTSLLEPWALGENDLPWLISLCKKKYSGRYDSISTETWFRNVVLKNPLMFHPTRLAHSFQISMLTCTPWLPAEFECHIVFVCAQDGYLWEAMRLMRASIDWARMRKCTRWRISSDTEFEFEGFARRLGASEISPRYTLEL